MATFQKIEKGQPDWQKPINDNFSLVESSFAETDASGWLTDGLTTGQNVSQVQNIGYRIVTIGTYSRLHLRAAMLVKQDLFTGKWASKESMLFGLPFDVSINDGLAPQSFTIRDGYSYKPVINAVMLSPDFPFSKDAPQNGIYFATLADPNDTVDNHKNDTLVHVNLWIDLTDKKE
ncbi:hypothetical protein HWN39_10755 [Lactobacillus rhamnosus]|uniref:Uncharacterized protein n=1 Tax=Lacticaseibacillus rhamnosus TaxID=47715 RepID=A0A7Y7UK49_LACRH|nr:hypothetical protein [Lacticaseibacillus rhamnosus]NVO88958.1 hypothetical protein [Lacticaseibacillus rhamnosus]